MKIRSHFQHSNLYTPLSSNCTTLPHFRPISQVEILEILNSMKKTMCDIDPCNIHFLMEFKYDLLSTWTLIIKTSLLNGSFLQPWKKLLSDLSSSNPNWARNSKAINASVMYLSSPKSIETAALLQISTYFEDKNLLSTYQSAYHKHHSTETAVLNICDEILQNAEHNKATAMVCLDLNTAFDTVNHTILKTVMEHYFGLKDTAHQWLSSYVSDRQFSVQIGNCFSQTQTINFSVP